VTINALIVVLMAWIGTHGYYDTSHMAPPSRVVLLPEKALQHVMYPHGLPAGFPDLRTDGAYDWSTNTIYLRDDFEPTNIADEAVLAHELTHYAQDVTREHFACKGDYERQAYGVQRRFAAEHGLKLNFGADWLKHETSC
jgi:hypothetical protein